jgi:GntR family transcriptional repressor for pyruvate dehydrogenase complex
MKARDDSAGDDEAHLEHAAGLLPEEERDALLVRIERTPLIEAVFGHLRDLVDSGRYGPGSKLPSERVLRAHLGVGRSTVREALRALEALGLIELQQGRGAFVRASGARGSATGPPFADWPRSYGWKIEDIVETRLAVEPRAAGLAALRRTDAELLAMRRHLDAFRAAMDSGDVSSLVLADVAFHDAIAGCANAVFASILKSLRVEGIRSRHTSLAQRDRWATVMRRHESIYDAIAEGDARAAAHRMQRHLLDFARELAVDLPTFEEWRV